MERGRAGAFPSVRRAQFAAREDEDGLREDVGFCRKAVQEVLYGRFGSDDGCRPERVEAAKLVFVAAAAHGGAIGIGAAFKRRKIIPPGLEQVFKDGIGRE